MIKIKISEIGLPVDSVLTPFLRSHSESQFVRDCEEYRAHSVLAFSQKFYIQKIIYRSPKGFKKILDAEVILWQKISEVAAMLYDHDIISIPSMYLLRGIIWENELVMLPFIDAAKFPKFTTGTQVYAIYQKQNKNLMDCDSTYENPFYGAITSMFAYEGMCFASGNKGWFRRDFWLPMIKARGEFIKVMKEGGFLLQDRELNCVTQGRKKLCNG